MADPVSVGPYRIVEKLGVGGMGEVFLAEQREPIRRRVALKLVRAGFDSAELIARFESERQALALMDHPNIARVFDAGTSDDGRPFFVMEYVKGEPITDFCDRVRLTTAERCRLMVRVCDAVQHAHQRAVIHRDLKPSNILVVQTDGGPEPKVIDFGVAKALAQPLTDRTLMTEFGQVIGTPAYMSPEQADTAMDRVDTRTDVYSLGVILYELLAGVLPFDREEMRQAGLQEVLRRVREVEPARPSTRVSSLGAASTTTAERRRTTTQQLQSQLRGDLDWIAMRALEKDPARRYGSATDLGRDIERFLRSEPVLAGPPSTLYRLRKFVRRHRLGVAFATVTAGLLLALAVTMAVQTAEVRSERDRATREAETSREVTRFLVGLFDAADPGSNAGREPTVRELLDLGAARIGALDGEPAVQAFLRTVLGEVYFTLGAFDEVGPLLDKSLAYHREHPAANPRDHAQLLNIRASYLDNAKNVPEQAEPVARQSLAIWRDLGDRAMAANALNTLATAIWHQGRIDEAADEFRESVAICEELHGAESPEVAIPLTNLGSVLMSGYDYAAAEAVYRRVADIERRQGDMQRNPNLGTTLHLLALVCQNLDRLPEAIDLEERALKIREAAFGPDHWHVALSLTTLGELYLDTDRAAAAEPLLERAVKIQTAAFDEHPDLWWAQRALARVQVALRKFDVAEQAMRRQSEVMQRYGDDDTRADCLEILGASAKARGAIDVAESCYRDAATAVERLRPPEERGRLRILRAFAEVLRNAGKREEAAEVEAGLAGARR